MSDRIRELRVHNQWTQSELAQRSGLSRQQISAIEADRNSPSVTAALALANAFSTSVEALFSHPQNPQPVLIEDARYDSQVLVRVDENVISVPSPRFCVDTESWNHIDTLGLAIATGASKDFLMVGCDPILGLLSHAIGPASHFWHCSSGQARELLLARHAHCAVVHGPIGEQVNNSQIVRFSLASWNIGIASKKKSNLESLISSGSPIVQREAGAAAQLTLNSALQRLGSPKIKGIQGSGHLGNAKLALELNAPALTFELAAIAFGLSFSPIERHQGELWIHRDTLTNPMCTKLLNIVNSHGFQKTVSLIGGYELDSCGTQNG